MTVYSINLGIGWASSGVEYAQAYRSQVFNQLEVDAKFIFSDLILANNISDLTRNLGFHDDQIIWLYNYFTDVKIGPSTYTLRDFEQAQGLNRRKYRKNLDEKNRIWIYVLPEEDLRIEARLNGQDTIDQVSFMANSKMLKREFYSSVKFATEYYDGQNPAKVLYRSFYNQDGSLAFNQYVAGKQETFEFADHRVFYSKNELYTEMIKDLHLTSKDILIMDREDHDESLLNGQIQFEYANGAKILVVIHAEHYDQHYTKDNILWNNFYEYQFDHADQVAAFITSTKDQEVILKQQLQTYTKFDPAVVTIPVGSLAKLHQPEKPRKQFSLITASRLADEKHIDWLVQAVALAKKQVPGLTFDIFGSGGNHDRLVKQIAQLKAEDYIHLMGQHDLTEVYQQYETYIAASTSEGFGLSLMEAIGSGLAMIGFNVPYGNTTFIKDQENGYLLDYDEEWTQSEKVKQLADAIVNLYQTDQVAKFSEKSYALAKNYLHDKIERSWADLLKDLSND